MDSFTLENALYFFCSTIIIQIFNKIILKNSYGSQGAFFVKKSSVFRNNLKLKCEIFQETTKKTR